jgi:beta-galactosidase
MLPFASEEFKARLKKWVEAGGTAILGPMTGYRDKEWAAFTNHATGNLEDWTGIEILERDPISSIPVDPLIPVGLQVEGFSSGKGPVCGLWTESLSAPKGKILATYTDGWLKGKPAIAETRVGKGKVIVLGTDPGKEVLQFLYKKAAAETGILPEAEGDEGVIVSPRGEKGYILVNLTNENRKVTIKGISSGTNLLNGQKIDGDAFTLAPYDVVVASKP